MTDHPNSPRRRLATPIRTRTCIQLFVVSLLCAWLAAPAVLPAATIEVPLLYYRNSPDPKGFGVFRDGTREGLSANAGRVSLRLASGAPPAEWKLTLPPDSKLRHATLRLGDQERPLVVLASNPSQPFFERIYFDTNANGVLDEPPVDGLINRSSMPFWSVSFPPTDTFVLVNGRQMPYRLSFSVHQAPGNAVAASAQTECFYSGSFRIAAKSYAVALGDANCNARFSDRFEMNTVHLGARTVPMPAGDALYLTDELRYQGIWPVWLPGKLLLERTLYDVAVSPSFDKLTLTPSAQPLVPVTTLSDAEAISLYGEPAAENLLIYKPGAGTAVPAGQWKLESYRITRSDAQGSSWTLVATAHGKVSLNAGSGPAVLTLGEPFRLLVRTIGGLRRPTAKPGDKVKTAVELDILGAGGETVSVVKRTYGVSTLVPMSNSQPGCPAEPMFRVVKPDGEMVYNGFFRYG